MQTNWETSVQHKTLHADTEKEPNPGHSLASGGFAGQTGSFNSPLTPHTGTEVHTSGTKSTAKESEEQNM